MEQSFNIRGRKYTLSSVSGTVLKEKRTSTTHVEGSMSINQYGGSGSIDSYVTVDQEIWITRDDDGKDFAIKFDKSLPLLEGQQITAISVSNGESSYWVWLYNKNTSKNYRIMTGDEFRQTYANILNDGCFTTIVLPILVFLGLYIFKLVTDHIDIPFELYIRYIQYKWGITGPIGLFILFFILNNAKRKRERKTFTDAVESYVAALGIPW